MFFGLIDRRLNDGLLKIFSWAFWAGLLEMAMVTTMRAVKGFSPWAVIWGMLERIFGEDWLADVTHLFGTENFLSFGSSGFFL